MPWGDSKRDAKTGDWEKAEIPADDRGGAAHASGSRAEALSG
jgi:hypothetical protein